MSNRLQVKVLSVGYGANFPCVVVSIDTRNVMIDMGEGTQRLCIEQKVKLVKLDAVLITRLCPETTGGLPGLCLTAIDSGRGELDLIGPKGINQYYYSLRFLMRRPDFNIRIQDSFPVDLDLDMGCLDAAPSEDILPKDLGTPVLKYGPGQNPELSIYRRTYEGRNGNVLVCYIIATKEQPGTFNLTAAKDLGISPGPLYSRLKNGETVEFERQEIIDEEEELKEESYSDRAKSPVDIPAIGIDTMMSVSSSSSSSSAKGAHKPKRYLPDVKPQSSGKRSKSFASAVAIDSSVRTRTVKVTVHPGQVLGSPQCARHAIILADFTTEPEALEQMCSDPTWALFWRQREQPAVLACDSVVHYSSKEVLSTPCYTEWVERMNGIEGGGPTHIGCGRGISIPMSAYADATRYSNKLHAVTAAATTNSASEPLASCRRPNVFTRMHLRDPTTSDTPVQSPIRIVSGYPGLCQVISSKGVQIQSTPALDSSLDTDVQEFVSPFLEGTDSNFAALGYTVRSEIDRCYNNPNNQKGVNIRQCRLSFLGTGSAIPSKYRNVTGILLQIPAKDSPEGMACLPSSVSDTCEDLIERLSKESVFATDVDAEHELAGVSCEHRSIMLDCGEGSWQQLLRIVDNNSYVAGEGRANIPTELPFMQTLQGHMISRIGAVWISHPHADHHLGLTRLLAERVRLAESLSQHGARALEPLVIIAPPSILNFLDDYLKLVPQIAGTFLTVSCCWLYPGHVENDRRREQYYLKQPTFEKCVENFDRAQRLLTAMGLEIINVPVKHCPESYGVRINITSSSSSCINTTTPDERLSVVYSGDCRPCSSLASLGKDCDILIHECSFDDAKGQQALDKNHSTVSEALGIGMQCGAKATVLTHFSQRYPGVPPPPYNVRPPVTIFDDVVSEVPEISRDAHGTIIEQARIAEYFRTSAVLAFDFMSFTIQDAEWLPALNPVLLHAFPTGEDDDDDEYEEEAKEDQAPIGVKAGAIGKKEKAVPIPFSFVRKGGAGCVCCVNGNHASLQEVREDNYQTSTAGDKLRSVGKKMKGGGAGGKERRP